MRLTKKEIKQDWFTEKITKLISLYYREKQKFYIAVGILVGIVIILIFALTGRGRENPEIQLRFTQALGLFSMQNFDQAEQHFAEIARRFANHHLGAKAYFYLGNIYFQTQRFNEAKRAFENFYRKRRSDPLLSPAALMGIANCQEEMGNLKQAAENYYQVYRRHPKSPLATDALLACGRCYQNLGNLDQAEKIYNLILKKNPTGPFAEEAKVQLSFTQTLKNKF
ncbi:MAG: tetratricopeptide repeat protein [candidate division WOR-3 bacterium]